MPEMYAPERRAAMVGAVRETGRASVADLAARFAVTTETVRRDLSALESEGFLRRVHGGAVPVESLATAEESVATRTGAHAREKAAIGAAAAALLPASGEVSMLIDAGSTTAQLAARLPRREGLTVITHSLPVAVVAGERGASVHVIGGRLRPVTEATVGPSVVARLATLRVDLAFIGTNGLSVARGCSTPDPEEAAVKTALVAAARRVVLLTDSSKLGQELLVSFARLEDIDTVVTDRGLPEEHERMLGERGIEVVLA